jgi:hypothetical protein
MKLLIKEQKRMEIFKRFGHLPIIQESSVNQKERPLTQFRKLD